MGNCWKCKGYNLVFCLHITLYVLLGIIMYVNTHLKCLIIDGRPRKPILLFALCVCVTVNWVAAQPNVRDLTYRTVQLVNSWLSNNLHWNGLEVRFAASPRGAAASAGSLELTNEHRVEYNGTSAREPRYGEQMNETSAADGAWEFLRSLFPNLYFPVTFYS